MKLNTKGFSHVEIVIVLAVLVILGGVGYYVVSNNSTSNSITSGSSLDDVETLPDDLNSALTLEEVRDLATESNEGASVTGIELEMEDGNPIYVVTLSNGSVVAFNALDGSSVSVDSEGDDSDDKPLPANLATKISLARAIEIAKEERPGVAIRKVEIEVEDGVLVYSVRFTDKGRVDVHANNGSVLEVRQEDGEKTRSRDSDDDDDDDKDDDDDDKKKKRDSDDDDDDDDKEDKKKKRDSDDDDDDDDDEDDSDDDDDDDDDDDENDS